MEELVRTCVFDHTWHSSVAHAQILALEMANQSQIWPKRKACLSELKVLVHMCRRFMTHERTDHIWRASCELQQLGAFALYVTELRKLTQPILRRQESVCGTMDQRRGVNVPVDATDAAAHELVRYVGWIGVTRRSHAQHMPHGFMSNPGFSTGGRGARAGTHQELSVLQQASLAERTGRKDAETQLRCGCCDGQLQRSCTGRHCPGGAHALPARLPRFSHARVCRQLDISAQRTGISIVTPAAHRQGIADRSMIHRVPEAMVDASFSKGDVDELLKGEMPGIILRQSQAVPRRHAVSTYAPILPASHSLMLRRRATRHLHEVVLWLRASGRP